jgi:cation diffusion facilitator family transporter
MDRIEKLALGSIAVAVAVLGLKALAYVLTGSVALYSDALESIINIVTAVAALVAVRLSAMPADRNHPYGHHKAEYFSVILEGICIALAAVSILHGALQALSAPRSIDAPVTGLLLSGVGTVVNAGWGLLLVRHGRAQRSPALMADGKHLFVDVYSSLGVVAGVILVVTTGWLVLDPIVAALVALNILWSGWALLKESVAGLMDAALPSDQLDRLQAILRAGRDGTIEIHDLKTRAAGRVVFIEFHLVVDGRMTVADSHAICDRLERALRAEAPDAVITIHVEPEHKAKQTGVMVVT